MLFTYMSAGMMIKIMLYYFVQVLVIGIKSVRLVNAIVIDSIWNSFSKKHMIVIIVLLGP